MRVGLGGAFGLDYPAVLAFASLSGPLSAEAADLLGASLPVVEAVILKSMKSGGDE